VAFLPGRRFEVDHREPPAVGETLAELRVLVGLVLVGLNGEPVGEATRVFGRIP
jgi:hypothetical protein